MIIMVQNRKWKGSTERLRTNPQIFAISIELDIRLFDISIYGNAAVTADSLRSPKLSPRFRSVQRHCETQVSLCAICISL